MSAELSPMLRQYYELKQRDSDAFLFFRMGDFYELFGDDAERVAPILDIVLTSREKNKDGARIPFCGVPHHSAKSYILKLLNKGYKVAIAEQMENPALAKGLVKRDIVKIYSPGCIDEIEGLAPDSPNYLLCAYEVPEKQQWAVLVADISTGDLKGGNVPDQNALKSLIENFKPREILCRRFCHELFLELTKDYRQHLPLVFTFLPELILRDQAEQLKLISEVFGPHHETWSLQDFAGSHAILGGLFEHLQNIKCSLRPFLRVSPLFEPETATLNEIAIRDLELFETARRRQTQGSLFHIINFTKSPMGARLLRFQLSYPMLNASLIEQRRDLVSFFVNCGEIHLDALRQIFSSVPDIQRLASRLAARTISPVELGKLRQALRILVATGNKLIQVGREKFPEQLKFIIDNFTQSQRPLTFLDQVLVDEPGHLGNGQVFKKGFDPNLDELSSLATNGSAKVEEYANKLREQTGINSLKIREHQSFGLLIEVTKSHLSKVPETFIRRQTMVNCERFVTMELKELDELLASALERLNAYEQELYTKLINELASEQETYYNLSQDFALLDLVQSLAWLAIRNHYTRPLTTENGDVKIIQGRHPVVEFFVGRERYCANDLTLDRNLPQALITGPNMAGKSTFMRQVALVGLLNQIGSYVPAQHASLPIFDAIYTRVGASDDLASGQSTFMVEMQESAFIVRHATSRSLVILDEVGRGTSTTDGLAIAAAILEHLSQQTRCYCLFATHYHELVDHVKAKWSNVKLLKTEVVEGTDGIIFTHQVNEGASDSSFGIEVAKLAGLPSDIILSAKNLLLSLDSKTLLPQVSPPTLATTVKIVDQVGSKSHSEAFKDENITPNCIDNIRNHKAHEILYQIEKANLNKMTPLQALNFLGKLQEQLYQPSTAPRGLFEKIIDNTQ